MKASLEHGFDQILENAFASGKERYQKCTIPAMPEMGGRKLPQLRHNGRIEPISAIAARSGPAPKPPLIAT
jgi:hypothetical protein